jgi:RNA polymerase sigma-70 factor (ECF subfamily)
MSGNPRVESATDKFVAIELHGPPADRWTGVDQSEALAAAIAGCKLHDRDMQRRLYELCHEKAYRLCARMVGRQDAADVCQQTFLKVFQSIDSFAGRSSFMTWQFRIAVNECLQHRRKTSRGHVFNLADIEPPDRAPPATQRIHDRDLLETALARLDPELRCAFVLREVEELSYTQIAEAIQIPEGTVASRLSRARLQLQEILTALQCQSAPDSVPRR